MAPLIPYFRAGSIDLFGVITVQAHGLMLVAGAALGSIVAIRKARRDGLDGDVLIRFLPWLFAAALVGGRLGELLFYDPARLVDDPLVLFRRDAGSSSLGAFVLVAGVAVWYFRRRANPLLYADALIYGATLGWFLGRMGCFLVHDHPGTETRFWLGVYGICPSHDLAAACHDLGLYEALLAFGLFAAATILGRHPRAAGFFVITLSLSYAVPRFLLDLLRHPLTDPRYFGLTPAQYGCIALAAAAAWMLFRRVRMRR